MSARWTWIVGGLAVGAGLWWFAPPMARELPGCWSTSKMARPPKIWPM
jgi:hypothetical protein